MAKHVKFISYTGEFPNLCRGVLTLEIDGEVYCFNRCTDRFWYTGGNVDFDENNREIIEEGDWQIDIDILPEKLRKYADEISEVLNENIERGCCGGCV